MAKLHELLAVESNLKTQAVKASADLLNTFEKKKHHFSESLVTFKPDGENEPSVVESVLALQTTIPKEINWISQFLTKAIDAGYQVAVANTSAKGSVILENGTVLIQDLPATALLELEKRLNEVQTLVSQIPTLDPAKGFVPAPEHSSDVFRARDVTKERTKKQNKPLTLAPATEKHPAQVQLVVEDVRVGLIVAQEWSGLITTARKGILLERVEELSRAVKQARARANEVETDTAKNRIGKTLLDHIFRS